MKSSDKKWYTRGIGDNPLQYSLPESPMDSMKSQKDITSEDEASRSEGVHYATGEEQRAIANSARMKKLAQSINDSCGCVWRWKRRSYHWAMT